MIDSAVAMDRLGGGGDSVADCESTQFIPASVAQRRLWLRDKIEDVGSAFHDAWAFRLIGAVDAAILARCLNEVIRRHDGLRTTFADVNGQPVQVISPALSIELGRIDLGELASPDPGERVARTVADLVVQPFRLDEAPLLRATLIRRSDSDHVLLLVTHQIIADPWSIRIILREISTLYSAFAAGQPSPLLAVAVRDGDFARLQGERLAPEAVDEHVRYFESVLRGAPPALDLPTKGRRPPLQTFAGARHYFTLEPDLVEPLRDLSRRERVEVQLILLAAFQVLLAGYTGQDDFVVGHVVDGRSRDDYRDFIGLLQTVLVVRSDLSDNPTFFELLARVQTGWNDALVHQDLPFELLVERLEGERDVSRHPIFQALFAFDEPVQTELTLPQITVRSVGVDCGTARYDLTLSMLNGEERIEGYVEFNTDLLDSSTIEHLIESYELILRSIITGPNSRISDVRLLGDSQLRQLQAWNETSAVNLGDESLSQLFEAQVERTPDGLAVVDGESAVTFCDLNARANQLARRLRRLGIGSESIVGLCVERSIEMMVALFAILKAGGAYLPLDPDLPRERLKFILGDAQPEIILVQERFADRVPPTPVPRLLLDQGWNDVASECMQNLDPVATPDNLAYVLYSSGSTGVPKGVLGLQRGVINRLRWMWDTYPLEADEVFCHKTPINWVSSLWETFGGLLRGCRLVLIKPETLRDPALLVRLLGEQQVTRILLLPSLVQAVLESFDDLASHLPRLKYWSTSGEPMSAELWRQFQARLPGRILINLYGTTELTSGVTYFDNRGSDPGAKVPIGRPISNTRLYVLNRWCQLVPLGVPGELYVGGASLARGYLGPPDLTEERFVPSTSTFDAGVEDRLYRTGDLVRWRADGTLEYLGRLDGQVKVRGQRLELGEVEVVLRQHPSVADCAVDAREIGTTGQRLVAYVVPSTQSPPGDNALRQYLGERLPAYMLPTAFVTLEGLPRTFNGKLDRKALPAPDSSRPRSDGAYVGPRNALEAELTRVWEEHLGVQHIGVRDDFFQLGGHSLLAVRLMLDVERRFTCRIALSQLFPDVTVEHLAQQIAKTTRLTAVDSVTPIQPHGSRLPLFCVHGLGGGVADYARLARHLGPDQPVYGLAAVHTRGDGNSLTELREMAALYAAALRRVQPDGPVRLIGQSFGGVLAYEIARQLQVVGREVSLLALLDTIAPGFDYYHPSLRLLTLVKFAENLPYWALDFLKLRPRLAIARTRRVARARLRELRARFGLGGDELRRVVLQDVLDDVGDLTDELRAFMETQVRARRAYKAETYPGRLVLFRARRQPLLCSFDPTLGWDRLALGGVRVRVIPGNHNSMVLEDALSLELAKQLVPLMDDKEA